MDLGEPQHARTMDDNAVALHEVFSSLRRAGFTESQALYLCAAVLTKRLGERDYDRLRRLLEGPDPAAGD